MSKTSSGLEDFAIRSANSVLHFHARQSVSRTYLTKSKLQNYKECRLHFWAITSMKPENRPFSKMAAENSNTLE